MFKEYASFGESGDPQVLIPSAVIAAYGEPSVNNFMLGGLFEELNLPPEKMTLKFYKGNELGEIPPPFDIWRNGYRTPYSNTLHIPAWDIMSSSVTPMSKVIALGLALSEKRQQKLSRRFLATEVTAVTAPALGFGLIENIGALTMVGSLGLTGVACAKLDHTNPGEIQYGQTPEVRELRSVHDRDITFALQTNLDYVS